MGPRPPEAWQHSAGLVQRYRGVINSHLGCLVHKEVCVCVCARACVSARTVRGVITSLLELPRYSYPYSITLLIIRSMTV